MRLPTGFDGIRAECRRDDAAVEWVSPVLSDGHFLVDRHAAFLHEVCLSGYEDATVSQLRRRRDRRPMEPIRGAPVQYRLDPKSGNRISALGLGCMRFPGAVVGWPDAKAADAIIARAVQDGINYLDTAYLYPGNEECVGTALERLGLRDQVYLATKLPHASCKAACDFDRFFDEQLRRLRTDRIDYYLMHNITSPAQWERLCGLGIEDWIERQKASGRISQIGFSYHGSAGDFRTMLDAYDWDFCQSQYNYTGERYQAGTAGLHLAAERGLAVFVMEPLLGGRLADKLPCRAKRIFDRAGERDLSTPAAWGLSWVWNHPLRTAHMSVACQRASWMSSPAWSLNSRRATAFPAPGADTACRARAASTSPVASARITRAMPMDGSRGSSSISRRVPSGRPNRSS